MSDEIKALRAELDALTAKMKPAHLVMAQALVAGKTQTEAYIETGLKGKNPVRCGSEMISENPNISEYVELAKKLANLEILPEKIATKEQKRKMLWEIATKASVLKLTVKGSEGESGEGGLEMFDATAAKTAVSAIAELNKMDGDLAAIKTENKNTTVQSLIDELIDGNG